MLTPSLAALRGQYPEAKIDLITLHRYVRDAFRKHPSLDRIFMLPEYNGKWIISSFAQRSHAGLVLTVIRHYPELLFSLARTRYDLGINFGLSDFDRSLGNTLLYCLNIPARVGSVGANVRMLTQGVKVDCKGTHRVDSYLAFLTVLGIVSARRSYEFPVQEADLSTVASMLRFEGIDVSKPLAVIQAGGKLHINSRRWPVEYFARVCGFLLQEGFEVVFTGDQEDASVCDEIAQSLGQTVASTAGRLNFSETAALLSRAELVITNDTSTLHLAEAVRVPRVISIFGPTDPSLLAPENERHIIFRSDLPCAPCMGGIIDATTERCWREVKEECLWQTKPEQVIGVLRTLYSKPAVRVARA